MAARFPFPAAPFVPFNEVERLRALTSTCLLDSACDPAFDAITRLAASAFQAEIAAVSLIDQHRQWFKSSVGLAVDETLREDSFCTHTILQRAPMVVLDARQDRRFRDKPAVTGAPGIRFYLGVPIRAEDGMPIGALCVADSAPREAVAPEAVALLQSLAGNIEKLIGVHRAAGYIDAGTGLPNQRRFRENAYSMTRRAAAAEPPTQSWAVSFAAASQTEVSRWLERNDDRRLDARLRAAAKWIAGGARLSAEISDGVYRLSTRHLGFFITATSESHALKLSSILQSGLDRLFPDTDDQWYPDAQRWPVRAVAVSGAAGAALIHMLLAPAAEPAGPRVHDDKRVAPGGDGVLEATVPLVETVATEPWQPRLALATQKCVGFDIDTSADGLAPTLRETVLSRFAQYGADAGQNVLGLHIAMSRNGFYTENLAAWLRMLTRFGLEPSQISWTIPVDVVRDDLGRAKARCEQVRATGIGVVVTGFGAGYDSLAWLPSLPLSGVSFDPRVIDVVCANADHAATVRRIVSLAHALSVRVSASGLHDALRFAAARLLDCDEGTGVGLGSPGVGPAVSTMAPVVTSTLDDPNRGFFSTRGTGANGADHGGAFATRSAFTKQGGVRTARFKEY